MIVTDQDVRLLAWASWILKSEFTPSTARWISKLNADGSPLVVVVFDKWTPHNCEMSIASDGSRRWYSKEFVSTCFRYAFHKCGLRRVTVAVNEENSKSLKMCRQLGYVQEAVLKNLFGEKDGVVFRMLKEECKWL